MTDYEYDGTKGTGESTHIDEYDFEAEAAKSMAADAFIKSDQPDDENKDLVTIRWQRPCDDNYVDAGLELLAELERLLVDTPKDVINEKLIVWRLKGKMTCSEMEYLIDWGVRVVQGKGDCPYSYDGQEGKDQGLVEFLENVPTAFAEDIITHDDMLDRFRKFRKSKPSVQGDLTNGSGANLNHTNKKENEDRASEGVAGAVAAGRPRGRT